MVETTADVGGTTGTGTDDESSSTAAHAEHDDRGHDDRADDGRSLRLDRQHGEIDYPDPLPPLDAAPLTTDVRSLRCTPSRPIDR